MIEYFSWVIKASNIIWPSLSDFKTSKHPYGYFHNAKPKHKTTHQQKPQSFGEGNINTFVSVVHICQRKVSILKDVTILGQRVLEHKAWRASRNVYIWELEEADHRREVWGLLNPGSFDIGNLKYHWLDDQYQSRLNFYLDKSESGKRFYFTKLEFWCFTCLINWNNQRSWDLFDLLPLHSSFEFWKTLSFIVLISSAGYFCLSLSKLKHYLVILSYLLAVRSW